MGIHVPSQITRGIEKELIRNTAEGGTDFTPFEKIEGVTSSLQLSSTYCILELVERMLSKHWCPATRRIGSDLSGMSLLEFQKQQHILNISQLHNYYTNYYASGL